MEAAELTGINLKPSMRTSGPSSLQETTDASSRATVGDITVEDPIFSCRDVDVFYGAKHAIKKVGIDVAAAEYRVIDGDVPHGLAHFRRQFHRRVVRHPAAGLQVDSGSFHLRRFHEFTTVVRIVCEG